MNVRSKAVSVVGIIVIIVLIVTMAPRRAETGTDIDSLIRRLDRDAPDDDAEQTLLDQGDGALPMLIEALSSENPRIRIRTARLLGRIGSASSVAALRELAERTDDTRKAGLAALGKIGGPEAAAYLCDVLLREEDPLTQRDVARSLGPIGANRAVDPLTKLLRDIASPNQVRRAAAEALVHFRDPRSRSALETAVKDDPDWWVYRAARKSLIVMKYDDRELARWDSLIDMAINKSPEPPEGAEAYVHRWHVSTARRAWVGPKVIDLAAEIEIRRAHQYLVREGEYRTGDLVERLVELYFGNSKIDSDQRERARRLIIDIGSSAVPALENCIRRGDNWLKRHCRKCLEGISGEQHAEDREISKSATRHAIGQPGSVTEEREFPSD